MRDEQRPVRGRAPPFKAGSGPSASFLDAERSPAAPLDAYLEPDVGPAIGEGEAARPGRHRSAPTGQETHRSRRRRQTSSAVWEVAVVGGSVGQADAMAVPRFNPERGRALAGKDHGDLRPECRPAPPDGLADVQRVAIEAERPTVDRPAAPAWVDPGSNGRRAANGRLRRGSVCPSSGAGVASLLFAPGHCVVIAGRKGHEPGP